MEQVFCRDKLTGADVILSFPIHENVFDNLEGVKEILHDDRDMRKLYPNLYKWSKMIKNQPSYKKICQTMDEEVEDLIASNQDLIMVKNRIYNLYYRQYGYLLFLVQFMVCSSY